MNRWTTLLLLAAACGSPPSPPANGADAGDAGDDAGAPDAGAPDASASCDAGCCAQSDCPAPDAGTAVCVAGACGSVADAPVTLKLVLDFAAAAAAMQPPSASLRVYADALPDGGTLTCAALVAAADPESPAFNRLGELVVYPLRGWTAGGTIQQSLVDVPGGAPRLVFARAWSGANASGALESSGCAEGVSAGADGGTVVVHVR